MWELRAPHPVKLIVGILASDQRGLEAAVDVLTAHIGPTDIVSDAWPFTQTRYYVEQTGPDILRQFLSFAELIEPNQLADMKLLTNELEQDLAKTLASAFPRPVNFDPGVIEPAKLVLASTKNFSHRIYIGKKIYAEVTLVFDKGLWRTLPYTYPDYRQQKYFDFFSQVRDRLVQQRRAATREG